MENQNPTDANKQKCAYSRVKSTIASLRPTSVPAQCAGAMCLALLMNTSAETVGGLTMKHFLKEEVLHEIQSYSN